MSLEGEYFGLKILLEFLSITLILLLFVMLHEVVLCKGINSAKPVGSHPAIKSLTVKMAGNLTQELFSWYNLIRSRNWYHGLILKTVLR